MKSKVLDILKFVIGWPLSLIALYFIFRLISPRLPEIIQSIKTLNISLLILSIVCFLGYYFFRTILWHKLIKHKGAKIPLKETVYLWSVSEINRYIPGNIWAVLSRGVRFGAKNMSKKDIATLLVHESLFVLVGAFIISLFSLPFLTTLPYVKPFFDVVSPQALILLTISGVTAFIFQKKILKMIGKSGERFQFLSPFDPLENIIFTLLSSGGLAFFGFGYYFALSSVITLPVNDFFTLSSFAIVSLLIGYLSFLTPTGLGVREGVLTVGLTQHVPVALAGFAALFARMALIISEVLFLLLATLWVNLRNSYFLTFEERLKRDITKTTLVFAVFLYVLYISVASFLRYDNFYTGRYDLGNMVQTVWNTSQGRIFEFTNPDGTEILSRLAFHADFILILFAPFYWIFPHPDLLLFVQALVVGIGAFFVYGIANHLLKHRLTSLLIALSFLLNPSVQRSNLYDFHAVVLGTTFLLAAWYYYLKKKWILLILFLFLAGITKEQVWAITAIFGLFIIGSEAVRFYKEKMKWSLFFISQQFLLGLSIFVVSSLLFYLMIWQFIPAARGGEHFALGFYGEFGNSPTDVVRSVIFEPLRVSQTVFSPSRIHYLEQLFLPVGFLSLLYPIGLIFAGPDLLINLLSSNANFQQIYYQYTATITPFLFISAIYAIWLLRKLVKRIPIILFGIYFLGMAIYGAYQYGPLPGSRLSNLAMFDRPTPNKEKIAAYLQTIPEEYKVAATNNAGGHLSERQYIFTIPVGMEEADILVFLIDPHPRRDLEHKERIVLLLNNPNYELVKQFDNFYVFQKTRYLTHF